jgi:hypothetical protein
MPRRLVPFASLPTRPALVLAVVLVVGCGGGRTISPEPAANPNASAKERMAKSPRIQGDTKLLPKKSRGRG